MVLTSEGVGKLEDSPDMPKVDTGRISQDLKDGTLIQKESSGKSGVWTDFYSIVERTSDIYQGHVQSVAYLGLS